MSVHAGLVDTFVASERRDPVVLPGAILIAALSFNAVLAVVNAHVSPLTPAAVIACEVTIVAAALAVALSSYRKEMDVWLVFAGILVLVALFRSLATQQIEARSLRDVLLIPTFVILGMSFNRRHLTELILITHAIVLAVLLLEIVNASLYSDVFKIQDYYVATRGYRYEDFWNKTSDLFVSGTRPQDRFFPFFGMHRMSSIFLEPVSLGNYCVAITAFLCAQWETLRAGARWFLSLSVATAIVACDGRFAALASFLVIGVSAVASLAPKHAAVIYLPAITALTALLTILGGYVPGSDDFIGRIALTWALLSQLDLTEFLGASDHYLAAAVDSGLAYTIITQSLIGTCIIWLFIVYGSADERRDQVRYNHALCMYVSLLLMVSFALFTIKTAALLWFIHGCFQQVPLSRRKQIERFRSQ
jgi:putative polymerase